MTGDPAGLADAARALADHLRFHQALGIRDLPLAGEPLGGPSSALRRVEAASAGCTRCKLSKGRTTIVFGSGKVYRYQVVPRRVYRELLEADSKGSYMRSCVIGVYPEYQLRRR